MAAPGSPGSQLAEGLAAAGAPELDPDLLLGGAPQRLADREYAVFKPRWGAFYQTPLDDLLREHGVDTVVWPAATSRTCATRRYQPMEVKDLRHCDVAP